MSSWKSNCAPCPRTVTLRWWLRDLSLYPHLYSRAYINFRNPDDILLFRDRFDGYIFIGNKDMEYPAVVDFAPFQKIAKRKLKKKDGKTGSIEEDPDYKQFLESYSLEEEKTSASPETLLGEIEAKTRGRRTTPLLEYIRNRKLEKQRVREEEREEQRRRELKKKRLWEEEKRKRREEDQCKRKEADMQKRAEKDVRIKLLKTLETGEVTTENPKERGEAFGAGDEKQEAQPEPPGERLQDVSDKEQRDKRFQEKEPETSRCHPDSCRKHSIHSEFARFSRRNEEESKWGKGFTQYRGKKG